jgi:hypothetical protein
MTNNIDQFSGQIDTVHGNFFNVSILFPVFLAGQKATEQSKWLVQSTVIPSASTDEIQVFYRGVAIKVVGDNTYPDWTVNFLNKKDFEIYKAVQRWREFCRSDILGTRANDLSYKTVATIEQLDGAGNVIYTVVAVGIWPKTVGEVSLSQDETNSVERFDVTFAVDYLLPEII